MKLRPLHDRVIVKGVENETKTASGIVFLTAPLKSLIKAKCWPLAQARRTTRAN